MKILKYIFLLLILFIIGLSVFVATQKSDFRTSKSVFLKVNRAIVFNYLNDYKNSENWQDNAENVKFTYSNVTSGAGASFTKNVKDGSEKTTTTFVKPNDSIIQKFESETANYISKLRFKDSLGGTKITWEISGHVDFTTKVLGTFSGGIDKLMAVFFEKSLKKLNIVLNKEINVFDIKNEGIVQKKGGFYLKQSTSCRKEDFEGKLQIMLPKMIYFFKNNNLKMNGKPFVIFENKDNDTLTFSVCGGLFEEIFFSDNSDVKVAFLEPFYAVKTSLYGHYSHLNKVKKNAISYAKVNNIVLDDIKNDMYIYTIIQDVDKKQLKWQTSLLTPIVYKFATPNPAPVIVPTVLIEASVPNKLNQ